MKSLKEYAAMTESRLAQLFPERADNVFPKDEIPGLLLSSMRYSVQAGGKRLRPAMLLATCEMLGGDVSEALDAACAIEMIHTYSLIHDDLPGMDDDNLRRGKPTNHVVFGVGQAILAGDGLLTMAFEVMLQNAKKYPEHAQRHIAAISQIARGAGVTGMVAGQCADLYAEGRECGEDMLSFIHRGKTMAMFVGACLAGACLAGANDAQTKAVRAYAEAFGILFQVSDDVLDVTADAELFGKSKGKDERDKKLTAVSVLTLDGAKARVEELVQEAQDALSCFGGEADFFRSLVETVAHRNH